MKKLVFSLILALISAFLLRKSSGDKLPILFFKAPSLILKKGDSVSTRVQLPKGFSRKKYPKNTFQEYIINYKLKPFGTKVINYDGTPYSFQDGHIGVLDLPITTNGLQQCADALIRIRSEFLWNQNKQSNIGFNFTSGHYCSWKKYAAGYRPKIKGNKVSFIKAATKDTTKANFYKYLDLIYMYAGTLSLYQEMPKVAVADLQVGDMVITPGSPGHVIMIVDMIFNEKGEKRFLLAQGNTPAQSVHILKNTDSSLSPWYEIVPNARLETPLYWFDKPHFIRFK